MDGAPKKYKDVLLLHTPATHHVDPGLSFSFPPALCRPLHDMTTSPITKPPVQMTPTHHLSIYLILFYYYYCTTSARDDMMIDYSLTKKRKKIKQKKRNCRQLACMYLTTGWCVDGRSIETRLLQLNIHPVGDSQRCAAHCVA